MSVIEPTTPGTQAATRATVQQEKLALNDDVKSLVVSTAREAAQKNNAWVGYTLVEDQTYSPGDNSPIIDTQFMNTFAIKGFSLDTESGNISDTKRYLSPNKTGYFTFKLHCKLKATLNGNTSTFEQDNFKIKLREVNPSGFTVDEEIYRVDQYNFFDPTNTSTANGYATYEAVIELDSGKQYNLILDNSGPIDTVTIDSGFFTVQRLDNENDIESDPNF